MDLDEFFKKHQIDTSDRPNRNLIYYCTTCGEFKSENTATRSSLEWVGERAIEAFYCTCHGKEKRLKDAHNLGINTPSMEWEREQLQAVLYRLNNQVEEIEKELLNYQ